MRGTFPVCCASAEWTQIRTEAARRENNDSVLHAFYLTLILSRQRRNFAKHSIEPAVVRPI